MKKGVRFFDFVMIMNFCFFF